MAISSEAERNHEVLFPGRVSTLQKIGYSRTLNALRVIDEVTPGVIADTNQEQP